MKKGNTNIGRRGFLKAIFGTAFAGTLFSNTKTSAAGKWESLTSSEGSMSPMESNSPFIAEIDMVAFNFAPRGWAQCNGQLLSILQNQALYSLLGITFGGDGINTFALPNLQGRSPLHIGQGFGLSNYSIGQIGGEVSHTLTIQELPMHIHSTKYSSNYGTSEKPVSLAPAKNSSAVPQYSTSYNSLMGATTSTGGNKPHDNMPPFTVINFIICLMGIYPSRD